MATPLYLISTAAEVNPGAEDERALSLTRGGGVVSSDATATVLGPTAGVQVKLGTVVACWISPPLAAVTIAGTVTFNLWGLESANQANTGFDVLVQRLDNAGAVQSTISRSERGIELTTSALVNLWTATPTSTGLSNGDRIKVTVFGNDAGGTMASGRTFTLTYNGTSAAANGDSYVQFFEALTVARIGTLAATQAAQTVASSGTVAVAGTLASTQAGHTLSSVGAVAIAGTLAAAQAAQASASSGTVKIAGTLVATQAAQTLASAGTVKVTGTLTIPDPLTDDLVAYWKLDEASGTRADATGRGNGLTPIHDLGATDGHIGGAFAGSFGVDFSPDTATYLDRVGAAPDLALGNIDFTIALWALFANTPVNPQNLIAKSYWGTREYVVGLTTNLRFWAGMADSDEDFELSGPALPITDPFVLDQWYFVLFDFTTATQIARLSVNGGTPATAIMPIPPAVVADAVFRLGFDETSWYFLDGAIDEVGIWKRQLTGDERTALYNAGAGTTHPFRAPLALDDQVLSSSGTVAIAATLAATQEAHTLAASGTVAIGGTLSAAQAGDTLIAEGTVVGGSRRKRVIHLPLRPKPLPAIAGSLSAAQAGQGLASTGTIGSAGAIASTQAAHRLASSGTVGGVGAIAARLAGGTLSSRGAVAVVGSLARAQADALLRGSGVVVVRGALTGRQAGNALRAGGMVFGDGTDDLMILGLESEDEELLLLV